MKIIFFGSDDFALTTLNGLLASHHQILACVTQPDRPRGRGLKVGGSPIKELAAARKLPLFQPQGLLDPVFVNAMNSFRCDLFVVVAYGQILPAAVLSIPYVCALNVHASLLPRYRGAAPVNWAILNGEKETGVSIIKMNDRMDAGDIVRQDSVTIGPDETSPELRQRLAKLGTEVLVKTINSLEKNDYILTVQDHRRVTFAPKLTKELGLISWGKSALTIHNQVRGLLPWPSAYTFFQGKQIKILETEVEDAQNHSQPAGSVIGITAKGIRVAASPGILLIKKLQPESGKAMEAVSFASGFHLKVAERFEFFPQEKMQERSE